MTIRGFTNLSSVPPLPSVAERDRVDFRDSAMRINSRTSFGTAGRPDLPCRIFQRQNKPKPLCCQQITVAGWMMKTRVSQSFQTEQSQAQRKRSAGVGLGRLTERWSTPI